MLLSKIMITRIILALFIASLTVSPVSAKSEGMSLTATGYEWLGYSPEEKQAFAKLLHVALNKKKDAYVAVDVIKKLDDFYRAAFRDAMKDPLNFDENDYLRIPCVKVIEGEF